jgi:hypothetical protein
MFDRIYHRARSTTEDSYVFWVDGSNFFKRYWPRRVRGRLPIPADLPPMTGFVRTCALRSCVLFRNRSIMNRVHNDVCSSLMLITRITSKVGVQQISDNSFANVVQFSKQSHCVAHQRAVDSMDTSDMHVSSWHGVRRGSSADFKSFIEERKEKGN